MWRFDFRFSAQDSYAVLPWILAFMVFLTLLCSAVALNIHRVTSHWQARYDQQLTVQIPADPARGIEPEELVAEFVKAPGVVEAEGVREEAVRMLLAPWLGEDVKLEALPVPLLVDIKLKSDDGALEAFQRWLAEQHPNARVDDHALWLSDFNRLVRSAGWFAMGVVGLVMGVTFVILVMSTRTELAMHRGTLLLLRDLGAEDEYIARQFQAKALTMAVQGSVAGMAAALATMLVFAQISSSIDAPFLPLMRLGWGHGMLFLLVAVGTIGLTVAAARITTHRELHRTLWRVRG